MRLWLIYYEFEIFLWYKKTNFNKLWVVSSSLNCFNFVHLNPLHNIVFLFAYIANKLSIREPDMIIFSIFPSFKLKIAFFLMFLVTQPSFSKLSLLIWNFGRVEKIRQRVETITKKQDKTATAWTQKFKLNI